MNGEILDTVIAVTKLYNYQITFIDTWSSLMMMMMMMVVVVVVVVAFCNLFALFCNVSALTDGLL